MKRMLIAALIVLTAAGAGLQDAQAKRLGGGGSYGKQSQQVQRSAPMQSTPAQTPAPSQAANATRGATPATVPPRPSSPWKSMLGGALLGLGLGALLSHLGIGGALASMISTVLMIALLAFAGLFIYRMLKRKPDTQAPKYAGAPGWQPANDTPMARTPEIGSGLGGALPATSAPTYGSTASVEAPWGVPADFDSAAFLRNAKSYFIRLQAAWDRADLDDIREFTTPEMYAEIRMQITERGATQNHTDVVSLDGQLLGIETTDGRYLASVKFSGMIREERGAEAQPFAEVWNLSKPVAGDGGWTLAGIQQLS
ncbi:Tim44 domain-containing protein [Noviherbaspirillum pedocola]|uniref:Tim44 domain-containing protein n=1 Tax=Noviherbaspirillum pedocola TaxID=2801341 RepID=A0A934SXL6_9BURK|nr:TIM44-like domain-containing protein [Noviherbaspirillum pedocola]MBK4737210.1 Tim44 domain-containing protein [Noviherbaspirillum pedocola]